MRSQPEVMDLLRPLLKENGAYSEAEFEDIYTSAQYSPPEQTIQWRLLAEYLEDNVPISTQPWVMRVIAIVQGKE